MKVIRLKGDLPFKFNLFQNKTRTFVDHEDIIFRAGMRSRLLKRKVEIEKNIKMKSAILELPHVMCDVIS